MMDYRMYSGGVPAGVNAVDLIKESLKKQGIRTSTPLKFVGFEGPVGTVFYLNNHKEVTKIPNAGKFITPFDGERYMPIYRLEFLSSFSGDIYYIV